MIPSESRSYTERDILARLALSPARLAHLLNSLAGRPRPESSAEWRSSSKHLLNPIEEVHAKGISS